MFLLDARKEDLDKPETDTCTHRMCTCRSCMCFGHAHEQVCEFESLGCFSPWDTHTHLHAYITCMYADFFGSFLPRDNSESVFAFLDEYALM